MLFPALRFPSEPCSQTRCDLFTGMYFQRIPTAEWARWRVRRQMRPRRGSRARSGRRRFVWCRASTAFGFHSTEERYVPCSTAGSAAVLDHSSPKAVGCARSGVGSAERPVWALSRLTVEEKATGIVLGPTLAPSRCYRKKHRLSSPGTLERAVLMQVSSRLLRFARRLRNSWGSTK